MGYIYIYIYIFNIEIGSWKFRYCHPTLNTPCNIHNLVPVQDIYSLYSTFITISSNDISKTFKSKLVYKVNTYYTYVS